MSGKQLAGEILKGHAGQYRSFSCPAGVLTREEEEQCLSGTLPGDRSRGNQTLRCVTCGSRRLLVSGYSAAQKSSSVDAVYQHAAFFENFHQWFESGTAHELAFFRFAGEEDFQSAADQRTQLSSGWPRRGAGLRETLCQLSLTPDRQAELACCCLSRGMTNDFGSLVILVPGREDYAAYCRTVMERILSCVPIGLWRYLSFATNPDETGKRSFAAIFAPEGTAVRNGEQTAIRLNDSAWKIGHSLRPETAELIHVAAFKPEILRTVSGELERTEVLERLTEKRYVDFWRQYQLRLKHIDCATLRQYCGQLGQHLSERDRNRLEEEIRTRLSTPGTLEGARRQDEALLRATGPEELDQGLVAYEAIFHVLGHGLDKAFSAELLGRLLTSGQPTLERLVGDMERLDRCRSAGESGVLDKAVVRACREELRRETEAANRRRQEEFERVIPDGWDWNRLRTLVEQLKLCQEKIRYSCLSKLSQLAAEHLERAGLPESGVREFYAQVSNLVGRGAELTPLEQWYQRWQQRLEERRKTLESMTSYRAYLELERPDEECLHRLLDYFEDNGFRGAGVAELLQAAELKWGEAWPRLVDKLEEMLKLLKREQRLGVWLEPGKSWAALYSELLACRGIERKVGEIRLCLWHQDAGEVKRVKLKKMLDTVEMFQLVVLGGKRDTYDWYDREPFQALLSAGMIPAKAAEALRDVLDNRELELLDGNTGRISGKQGKKQKKLRPAFVALMFSAALLLMVIGMALGLLVALATAQPQPSETPGTEQSGEPAPQPSHSVNAEFIPAPSESEKQVVPSQQVSASPSPSQSGGVVTPRQPGTSESGRENGGTDAVQPQQSSSAGDTMEE